MAANGKDQPALSKGTSRCALHCRRKGAPSVCAADPWAGRRALRVARDPPRGRPGAAHLSAGTRLHSAAPRACHPGPCSAPRHTGTVFQNRPARTMRHAPACKSDTGGNGRVAERSIAPVLKTGDGQPSVGSNPTPSANFPDRQCACGRFADSAGCLPGGRLDDDGACYTQLASVLAEPASKGGGLALGEAVWRVPVRRTGF